MKYFYTPKVYLIAEPKLNIQYINAFFADNNLYWTDTSINKQAIGDKLIEFAGRICYVSFGSKQGRTNNKDYLENILSSGHGSVLEHANYTFLITNVSRGFTHEIVRHRAGFAYSQESTHYINYSPFTGNVNIPQILKKQYKLKEIFKKTCYNSLKNYEIVYNSLIKQGINKKIACSTARQLLPTGIESKIVFTANIRALRHFITSRANCHNVKEIRDVALLIYDIMKEKAPNCFMDMKKFKDIDGFDSINQLYKKV